MPERAAFDVLVIGAGPAGAAAARALARSGAHVLLCERGMLPRHRLCGEFVSPEAVADLVALDLDLGAQGAVRIDAARFVAGVSSVAALAFEHPAYAVSRYVLDRWLAESAAAAGATLWTATRVVALAGTASHGYTAELRGDQACSIHARFVIAATGKHPGGFEPRLAASVAPGWLALKTHLRGAAATRLEMHAFDGGYIGFAPIESGRTNVCAVARIGALPSTRAGGAAGALAAIVRDLPHWQAGWESADPDSEALCSESGTRFGVAAPLLGDVLRAGDAAALPHPVGGDGIAMALRGGRLAAAWIGAALCGAIPAEQVASRYADAWQREFRARLRWCAWVHGALERPWMARPLLAALAGWPAGMRFLTRRTRGATAAASFFAPEVQV